MNKLTLTKQGFYNDIKNLESIDSQLMLIKSGILIPQISVNYLENLKMIIDILTDSSKKTHYTLDFPEKHFPNNMSFLFWSKVSKLMENGISFTVKTSDVMSLAAIKVIGNNEVLSKNPGWNIAEKLIYEESEDAWFSEGLEKPIEISIDSLVKQYKF